MTRANAIGRRNGESGQVLILAVVAMILIVIAALLLYDVQTVIRGKVKAQNAVDAALRLDLAADHGLNVEEQQGRDHDEDHRHEGQDQHLPALAVSSSVRRRPLHAGHSRKRDEWFVSSESPEIVTDS